MKSGGSILINAQNDFTTKGASIHSIGDTTINAGGNVNIGAAYSKSTFDIGDTSETNSKSVNTTIQTGTGDATHIMIKKAENDQKIQDINISLADLKKQKHDLKDALTNPESDEFMQALALLN